MKIFFSYPHDDNAPLVDRIKNDLEARGHQIWFDQDKIKEGDQWRNSITRGILDSESFVAFLSKHSVRDPGVCLSEIAIGLAEKGDGAIVTVLVEPEKEVSAPISVTHIQWLRMEDWPDKASDDAWYRTKLDKLIEVIEHPASVSRNEELERLRLALDPLSFNAEIAPHLPHFTGRKWIFERYEKWLAAPLSSPVFRIEGGPGLGKTAIASQLAHASKSSVIAIFFCQYNRGDSRNPLRLIQTLAYQLASRLPDYRMRLLKVPAIAQPELMTGKDATSLWATLIAEPLAGVGKEGLIGRQRFVIVVDGLDEATDNGKNEIVRLLAEHIPKLPAWIGVVLTGRPDPEVAQRLSRFQSDVIYGDDSENQSDLKAYIEDWLAEEVAASKIDSRDIPRVAAALLEKSDGAFLYLVKAREASDIGEFDLTHPASLPNGLTEIYLQFFERRFPHPSDEASLWVTKVKPLLAHILASPEPLPFDLAREVMGWDSAADGEEVEAQVLRSLGSLMARRSARNDCALQLFHKSVREWLQNDELDYFVSTRGALKSLTAAVWYRYVKRSEQDVYAWAVLPILLPLLRERLPDVFTALLGPPNWETSQILFRLADSLTPKLRFADANEMWLLQVSYCELLAGEASDNADFALNVSRSCMRLGDVQVALGSTHEALRTFERGLAAIEHLHSLAANHAIIANDLFFSYIRLGDLHRILGNRQTALKYFMQSLEISQGEMRGICYDRLGDIYLELGEQQLAFSYFDKGFAIFESKYDAVPQNAGVGYFLSRSYDRVGEQHSLLDDTAGAIRYFEKGLTIRERLFAADPESADYAMSLTTSYDKLGSAQKKIGNYQQALIYFNQSLAIFERLRTAAPTNVFFSQGLGVAYNRLGDLQVERGSPQDAIMYFEQGLLIRQKLCSDDAGNAFCARDLAISYSKLAQISGRGDQQSWWQKCYTQLKSMEERLILADSDKPLMDYAYLQGYCFS